MSPRDWKCVRTHAVGLATAAAAMAFFAQAASAGCFDFNTKVGKPLRPPMDLVEGKDVSAAGQEADKTVWATARGLVNKPMKELVEKMLDPMTLKNPRNTKIEVKKVAKPDYLLFQEVHIHMKPIIFVSVDWDEQWAYTVLEGKNEDPKSLLISYEKVAGTDHIQKLCGSVTLKSLPDGKTDVAIVEEVISDRRSVEDAEKGLHGTLETLRK